jgi:hypothetical protein
VRCIFLALLLLGCGDDVSFSVNMHPRFVRQPFKDAGVDALYRSKNVNLYALGDSILDGAGASDVAHQVQSLMALSYPGIITDASAGGRDLRFYAVDAARRTQVVGIIAAINPKVTEVWINLMVNDYTNADWNPTDYTAAYAAFVDELHVALPSATIYCQTATYRHDPTPNNALGFNLQDYRDAAEAALLDRPGIRLVPGRYFADIADADMSDVVHFNDSGNAKYATAIAGTVDWP